MSNYVDAKSFPLPPPWQLLNMNGKDAYINDVTGSIVDQHPLQAVIDQMAARANNETTENTASDGSAIENRKEADSTESEQLAIGQQDQLVVAPPSPPAQTTDNRSIGVTTVNSAEDTTHFVEFRCNWKENGLFGDVKSFGVVIRYFGDQRTMIRFDGVDARWEYSLLQGAHGPVGRYDLFVGARVKLFGRQLTISSCNATVCHAIEMEGKRLMKKQAWLQTRIESLGGTPVVRRTNDAGGTVIRNIQRSSKSYGSTNLRRLHRENCRLKEQMAGMGLGQVVLEYEAAELQSKKYRKPENFEGRLLYEELHEMQPDV